MINNIYNTSNINLINSPLEQFEVSNFNKYKCTFIWLFKYNFK